MRRALATLLLTLLATAPASAQMNHGASLEGVQGLYQTVRDYLLASADQASQELYGYRPTDQVRSFGEILGHVTNASYSFCAAAMGEEAPQRANAEELTSKAEITSALGEAFQYCDRAYGMDAGRAEEGVTFFGQEHTRLSVLAFNMGHDFEHYGNLVTYMRLNDMVPPSSQGGM